MLLLPAHDRHPKHTRDRIQAMDLRLRRAVGMLKLGRAAEAVEAAVEAGREAGQPPLSAVSVAARVAAAGAKSLCDGEEEEEALDELTALKVHIRVLRFLLGVGGALRHLGEMPLFPRFCPRVIALVFRAWS